MVNHPVLFETFVRVETARQVWEQIKKAQPSKLYFYSNKGRAEIPGEIERNNQIRSFIDEIDWECDLHTFFREECVDVYTSLMSSKKWIFKNEDSAIILEDDCVPSKGFFQYCDHFLDIYKDNPKIFAISGDNYTTYKPKNDEDHIISRKGNIYGWATWKDRFESVDFNIEPKDLTYKAFKKHFKGLYSHCLSQFLFYKTLQRFVHKTHCWDFAWGMSCIETNRYFVMPIKHLVKNAGIVGEHSSGNTKDVVFTMPTDLDADYVFTNKKITTTPNNEFDRLFFNARWPICKCYERYFIYLIKKFLRRNV